MGLRSFSSCVLVGALSPSVSYPGHSDSPGDEALRLPEIARNACGDSQPALEWAACDRE